MTTDGVCTPDEFQDCAWVSNCGFSSGYTTSCTGEEIFEVNLIAICSENAIPNKDDWSEACPAGGGLPGNRLTLNCGQCE